MDNAKDVLHKFVADRVPEEIKVQHRADGTIYKAIIETADARCRSDHHGVTGRNCRTICSECRPRRAALAEIGPGGAIDRLTDI